MSLRTLVLCGGKGTRAYPHAVELPKPLLEVAGCPILEHVMRIYALQDFRHFVLAAGFKVEAIQKFSEQAPEEWTIDVLDTGEETNTGGRVHRSRHALSPTFFLTYADGVGNIDLHSLLAFHRSHPGSATVTIVPLPSQYGTIDVDGDGRVQRFIEKPTMHDHWINAGFFVMDQRVFDDWQGEDLEREVLPRLGERGELFAYRHRGFWKSMDTYKDALALSALYEEHFQKDGRPPWLRFEVREPS